jgi:ABC-type transport system involved in multi-copper enzyme maturation permease subunit
MRWLLWKEFRQNIAIVVAAVLFLVAPYLLMVCVGLSTKGSPTDWDVCFLLSSLFSLMLGQVAIAAAAGNAFAGERADRTAEFQAYLPIPRGKVVVGKLLFVLAIAGMIWLPNLIVLWSATNAATTRAMNYSNVELVAELLNTAITGLAFFCVAWLFSSFFSSSAFATIAGLVAPLIVVLSVASICYLCGFTPEPNVQPWYRAICLTLSPLCFAIGTRLYLTRVEP